MPTGLASGWAYITKIKNLQNTARTPDQQIIQEEKFIFRLSQQQLLDEDVSQLPHNMPTQRRSRLNLLSPSIYRDVIIRSKNRQANPKVSTATKTPILLDCKKKIFCFFVVMLEFNNKHTSFSCTIVFQCKTAMKKISNRCYECRRQKQLNSQPQMSDLPITDSQSDLRSSGKPEQIFWTLWNLDWHGLESLL